MKTKTMLPRLIPLLAIAFAVSSVHADSKERKVAGPNGGRIITTVEPNAEFFVMPDRKVQITFLDPAGKAIPPAAQTVTVTAGERSAPQTLTFAKSGNTLVSNAPLPKGDAIPTVVQIKSAANARTVTAKFNVDMSRCGECKLSEYACICGH